LVGSVPLPGARLQWRGIQFEVVKVEGQRIIEVRAKLAEKASTGDAMSD